MIFSVLLPVQKALEILKTDRPQLIQIQDMLHKIDVDQKEIVFVCVPGHVGIGGNQAVGRAVKKALDEEPTDEPKPFSDGKPLTAK